VAEALTRPTNNIRLDGVCPWLVASTSKIGLPADLCAA
jgi:hypothetical protein